MKSCIFYTLLTPLLYTLLWYQGEYLIPVFMAPAVHLLDMLLPSLVCNIGWLWIQRRPIRSTETPYICFILPLLITLIANYCSVYSLGYDGINTIFGHVIILAANVACCAGLVGLTWILRMLWLASQPRNNSEI
ncbi:MAG: hypothetical protein IJN29_14125 [Akkermansia sp.]|nr:hypothetical protein [Akkermansia sp.]